MHNMLNLESGDILIHCGDACSRGNYSEGEDFLWWLVQQPFKYKIFIPGNHDRGLKTHFDLITLANRLGIIVLRNQMKVIEGLTFWGGDFVSFIRNGVYLQDREEREEAWKNMPTEGVDILLTHAPPRGILDSNVRGEPCGCDVLLEKALVLQPKYHIFGHIHEHGEEMQGYGPTESKILAINCSCTNELYALCRKPIILEV